ncbi:hypothetical protein C1646_765249 [Rhizophagus diaphanus]|nr:hypothetical protein C1646_765249 [Rhizophagus diaphanus] [Rhizophagus sp. MUCL 43196]
MRVIDLPNNSSRWLLERCVGDKIEVYEFLEALGLLDNKVTPINMDDDDNNESDIDEEDSDNDQDNYWDPRKRYTG